MSIINCFEKFPQYNNFATEQRLLVYCYFFVCMVTSIHLKDSVDRLTSSTNVICTNEVKTTYLCCSRPSILLKIVAFSVHLIQNFDHQRDYDREGKLLGFELEC